MAYKWLQKVNEGILEQCFATGGLVNCKANVLWNRESRDYRERGGIMARRAGSGGEWLGGFPAEGYLFLIHAFSFEKFSGMKKEVFM